MECSATKNRCTCTYPGCDKHGSCCKCVAYHNDRAEIPGCFFSPAGEKSYDRSFANLVKDRQR